MGYPVAYLSGNTTTYETGMFKRGTIGQNQAAALTGNYRWWNGIDVTASQYLIYSDTFTTSASTASNATPAAWSTPDLADQSLLNLINTLPERIGKLPFTYLPVALQWIQSTGRYFLIKNGYENIVTNGLALNLDAGWYLSYSGTGTNWKDLSGSNNGTLTNGPTFSNSNGGSIVFDGTDDYVLGHSSMSISQNQPFTLEFWVNLSSYTNQYPCLLQVKTDTTHGFIVFVTQASTYDGITFGSTDTWIRLRNAGNQIATNTWNQIVINYNGAGAGTASNYKMYLNTIEQVLSDSGSFIGLSQVNNIGTIENASRGYDNWTGRIANFKQYNRALIQSEVIQNFNTQKTRFGLTADTIVTSGLTLNLDAGSVISYPTTGTSWYDVSYVNNNATLNNGPTFVSSGLSISILFDGTDYYAPVALYTPPNNTSMTLNIWTKATSNPTTQRTTLMSKWGSSTKGNFSWLLFLNWFGDNNLYFLVGNSAGNNYSTATMTSNLSTSQYENFSVTYDSGNINMYRNGTLIVTTTSAYTTLKSVPTPLTIGADWDNGSIDTLLRHYNGNIANSQIYNRALSATEILQNYNALKGRYGL